MKILLEDKNISIEKVTISVSTKIINDRLYLSLGVSLYWCNFYCIFVFVMYFHWKFYYIFIILLFTEF